MQYSYLYVTTQNIGINNCWVSTMTDKTVSISVKITLFTYLFNFLRYKYDLSFQYSKFVLYLLFKVIMHY